MEVVDVPDGETEIDGTGEISVEGLSSVNVLDGEN